MTLRTSLGMFRYEFIDQNIEEHDSSAVVQQRLSFNYRSQLLRSSCKVFCKQKKNFKKYSQCSPWKDSLIVKSFNNVYPKHLPLRETL
jgi:hypothetical protein